MSLRWIGWPSEKLIEAINFENPIYSETLLLKPSGDGFPIRARS